MPFGEGMESLFDRGSLSDQTPAGEILEDDQVMSMPEDIKYTLTHHNEHGTIPVFFGNSEVVSQLNELAKQGKIIPPTGEEVN